jgi:hypothetical protein
VIGLVAARDAFEDGLHAQAAQALDQLGGLRELLERAYVPRDRATPGRK